MERIPSIAENKTLNRVTFSNGLIDEHQWRYFVITFLFLSKYNIWNVRVAKLCTEQFA